MRSEEIMRLLHEGFASAERPRPDEVVSHACAECFRIRDDFSPHVWSEVPPSVFEYHWDSFPLFTPRAFRYYLPGYMKHTLDYPQSDVAGWTIEKLRDLCHPDGFWTQRSGLLTAAEEQAIRAFLRFVYAAPEFARLRSDSYDALVCWGEHPEGA